MPVEDVHAAVDAYAKERDDEVATVRQRVAALEAEVADLQAEVATLQTEFDEHMATHTEPEPTPPVEEDVAKPKLGAWIARLSGETQETALARFENTCGKVQIIRIYDGGAGPKTALNNAKPFLGKMGVCLSFKPAGDNAANYNNGSMDADVDFVLNEISRLRGSFKVYVICGHEPDLNWGNYGGATGTNCKYGLRTDTKKMYARFHDKVQAHGDAGIVDVLNLVGWDFSKRVDTFWTQGKCSVLASDPYFSKNGLTAQAMVTTYYVNIWQWCKDHQQKWAICETGPLGPTTGKHTGDVTDITNGIKSYSWFYNNDWKPEFVLQFNEDKADGAMRIDNKAAPAAAFKALARV